MTTSSYSHNENDHLQRFLFEHQALRGQFVRLHASYSAILKKHDYPPILQEILGQTLCASALLSSTIKFDGSLTIQLQSNGPVTMLVGECNHNYQLRGIARWQDIPEDATLETLFPEGRMVITIDPDNAGSRYQAIVEMKGHSIADYLTNYFLQSEQLNTKLILATRGHHAAGMLLQTLPETAAVKNPVDWEHFITLTETLSTLELLNTDNETLLRRLYHGDEIRLYDATPICFRCSCSRERLANAIRHLGETEVQAIIEEQGQISATCEFCNQAYYFDKVDSQNLFHPESSIAPSSDKKH